jgi:hypothetical protein
LTGPQIIVLATPVFLVLIGLELAIGLRRGRNTYRLNDALSSIGLGVLSQVAGLFSALLRLGIYSAVYVGLAIWQLPVDSPWTWLGALVAYDFLYYWHHRAGHRIAVFWAAHVVHHQSEDYNLSTALRQTSSGWLFGWVFYLPMALAGVPPLVFAIVALGRPAVPVLGPYRARRPPRLVRPLVLRPEQPPRPPRGERRLPRPQLRRHPHRLGPALRHLCRRGSEGPLRLRHARAAAQLEPHPRQSAGLRRARPRHLANPALARQGGALAEATRLAPCRPRRSGAEGPVRPGCGRALRQP